MENCEKKIKFLANNNITVESVAKEKEEKRKRIERHKRAILNSNTTLQGAEAADLVLADILAEEERKNAEEERKKLLQKEAAAPAAQVPISPSEFKGPSGGRKTRRKKRRKKRKSRRKKKTRRRRKKRKTRKRRR